MSEEAHLYLALTVVREMKTKSKCLLLTVNHPAKSVHHKSTDTASISLETAEMKSKGEMETIRFIL